MTTYRYSVRDHVLLPDIAESDHDTIEDAQREAVRIVHSLLEVATLDPAYDIVVTAADTRGETQFVMTLHFAEALSRRAA